jgi:hypothetical protein
VLLSFSEFGRRPQENASLGTDHGTANCVFAFGGKGVVGGIYGGQPDLVNLLAGNQGGNLRHQIDFRAVYSVILRDWLGADPESIFGSADFNNPAFGISSGMNSARFIDENAGITPTTVWVDKNYTGFENGSYDRPFRTVQTATNRVATGGVVKLKTGSTRVNTAQTITKKVRIQKN